MTAKVPGSRRSFLKGALASPILLAGSAALAPCAFAGAIAAEPAITSGVASAPLRNDRREPGAFAVMRISFFVVGPALSWRLQARRPQ